MAHDDHESIGATLCLFTVEQSEIFWKAFVIGAVVSETIFADTKSTIVIFSKIHRSKGKTLIIVGV